MNFTKDQQKAIDKKNSNILVAASAGSGKTAVLVERIIKRIIEENININKMLIVTFTKAAAGEMKERINDAIDKKLKENSGNKHLIRQKRYIKNAYITTMDSFFLDIVKTNFYRQEGIDPNINIADSNQIYEYKEKVFLELLDEEYEIEDNVEFQRIYNILYDAREEDFKEMIFSLYNFIQSFPYPFAYLDEMVEKYNLEGVFSLYETDYGKYIYNKLKEDVKVDKKNLELAEDAVSLDEQLAEKYTELLEKEMNNLSLLVQDEVPNFNKIYSMISSKSIFGTAPKIKNVEDVELKEYVAGIRKSVKASIEKYKDIIYATEDIMLEDLKRTYVDVKYIANLIKKFDANYTKIKKEKNVMEFNDVAHAALNMLIERKVEDGKEVLIPTDIAEIYREKFDEIYIDEYQDSNFVQEYVLKAVSKVDKGEPNQFMVGDVKQSIYKFRQAMPILFSQKYDTYSEDEDAKFTKIILAQNFRSRKEVIDGINYIFQKIMSKEAGECSYQGKECLYPGANYGENTEQDYKVEVDYVEITKDEVEEYESNDEIIEEVVESSKMQLEAEVIAEKIKELVNEENPFKVYDLKKQEFRDIKYSDIVILLRSSGISKKDNVLEEKLKENHIPAFSDKSVGMTNVEEVKFILSFLSLLDNWYQDIPLIAVMYSIIGNFTLDEIAKIRQNSKHGYVLDAVINAKEMKDKELAKKCTDFLNLLEKFTYYSKYYGISELIWKIYNETNIYEQYLLKEDGDLKCANLDNLLNVAVEFEKNEYRGLTHFIKYMKDLKADDSAKEARIIGENENVVRIMTIHKSKGLEFPVVFLADANTTYRLITKDKILMHSKYGIGTNIITDHDNIAVMHESIARHVIKNVNREEAISEEMRMLYVAMTRAKEKLYVVGSGNSLEKELEKIVVVKDKNGCIDSSFVLSNTSYMKQILLAAKEDIGTKNCGINLKKYSKNQLSLKPKKEDEEFNYFENFENFAKEVSDEDISKYKEILDYEYPYANSTKVGLKYSVSELKKFSTEDEEETLENISNTVKDMSVKIPKFMRKNEKTTYTSAQKGTLIHLVLSNIDFRKNNTKETIDELINKLILEKIITEEEKKYIPYSKILNFANSEIALKMKDANVIEKEKPFVYRFIPSEIPVVKEKLNVNDPILVQGIIDIYFIDRNNKITLIDYKTDRIEEDNEFIEKYKLQLELYKRALQDITKFEVENVYIYSIHKEKLIKV